MSTVVQRSSAAGSRRRARTRQATIDLTAGAGRRRRRVDRVVAVLVAVGAVVAAAVVVSDAVSAASDTVTGAVEPASPVFLDFPGTWSVGAVDVRVGETVRAGEVLAVQADRAALGLVVTADQRTLVADEAGLRSVRRAAALAAGASAADAQGATAAGTAAAAATAGAAAVASATAAARVDAAEAALQRDEAQLRRDEAAYAAAVLVAPTAGRVVAVNGAPGDAAGPGGVRSTAPPLVASGAATLALLPTATPVGGGTSVGTSGGILPMIELASGPGTSVVVAVPQSLAPRVGPATWATIRVDALGGRPLRGRLSSMSPTPEVLDGRIVYPATFDLAGPLPGALPGLTAGVTLHRLR